MKYVWERNNTMQALVELRNVQAELNDSPQSSPALAREPMKPLRKLQTIGEKILATPSSSFRIPEKEMRFC